MLGLSQTYPTVLGLTQSHCPSHPTVLGYWDYPGNILLYLSLTQPHCPSHPTVLEYWHIPLYWVSLSPTVLPIPQSRDTRIIPDISHCTGSHSVSLSFPSHSPGILGLSQTYPTLPRSHSVPLSFPSHILGYWVYPRHIPLYSHCPFHPTVLG